TLGESLPSATALAQAALKSFSTSSGDCLPNPWGKTTYLTTRAPPPSSSSHTSAIASFFPALMGLPHRIAACGVAFARSLQRFARTLRRKRRARSVIEVRGGVRLGADDADQAELDAAVLGRVVVGADLGDDR